MAHLEIPENQQVGPGSSSGSDEESRRRDVSVRAHAHAMSGGQPHAARESDSWYCGDEMQVLLLVPHRRDSLLTAEALTGTGFSVTTMASVEELTRRLLTGRAGVSVIAQEALSPANLDRLDRVLVQQPAWSDLPLIILTGGGGAAVLSAQESFLQDSERLSNATFLERPLRIATLVRAVRVGLRSRRRQYEIRGYLQDRERAAAERVALMEQQRTFLRDVLTSVTEGRLRLCDTAADLPPLPASNQPRAEGILLSRSTLTRLRQRTRAIARLVEMLPERTADLITAANEAAMNAVQHAGGGIASVYADTKRCVVLVRIEDRGAGIDMAWLPRATLERGSSSAGTLGHGFWLMLQTADAVYLLTGPKGTTVVIEQAVTPPPLPAWRRGPRVEPETGCMPG